MDAFDLVLLGCFAPLAVPLAVLAYDAQRWLRREAWLWIEAIAAVLVVGLYLMARDANDREQD
jgi:hypothetical protein